MMADEESYLTPQEAAAYLRLSPRTLEEYRIKKIGPGYFRLGAHKRASVLYRKQDLDAWMEGLIVRPQSSSTRQELDRETKSC